MATILYINGKQVYPDSSQNIKLTKENPYFTESESYTLDVTLPMDIAENRMLFGNLQRMDCTKRVTPMNCQLIVNNRLELEGKARVTHITDREVKVQLLGGRSEVNFMSDENQDYIDEMDLGVVVAEMIGNSGNGRAEYEYTTSSGMRVKVTPVYDETHDWSRNTAQICLIDLLHFVIEHYGFTVTEDEMDTEPWNCIYVATALETRYIKRTLPHWTVREFISEVCKFFNIKLYIDQAERTVKIKSNIGFKAEQMVRISPIDEYTAEITEDAASSMANDTLEFSLSDSGYHDYDCMKDDLREGISRMNYSSRSAALVAWEGMTKAVREKYVFTCPEGDFASWIQAYNYKGEGTPEEAFTKIDMFRPMERENGNRTELKIAPVAMAYIYNETKVNGATYKSWYNMPVMANALPNDGLILSYDGGRSGTEALPDMSVQKYIESGEGQEKATEKEDRMQVMFIDDTKQTYNAEYSSVRGGWSEYEGAVGFTDYEYKPHHVGQAHRAWSMALKKSDATYWLGLLHQNGYRFNAGAKQRFQFIEDQMPNPNHLFMIKGKLYGCEKIEANVNAEGFDKLMTGYFYEML